MKCPLQLVTNITILLTWPYALGQTHSVDQIQSIVLFVQASRLSSQKRPGPIAWYWFIWLHKNGQWTRN